MATERVPLEDRVAEVLDRVLDKGLSVDAATRLSPGGIRLQGDVRVVVGKSETYLRHAVVAPGGRAVPPRVRLAGNVLDATVMEAPAPIKVERTEPGGAAEGPDGMVGPAKEP